MPSLWWDTVLPNIELRILLVRCQSQLLHAGKYGILQPLTLHGALVVCRTAHRVGSSNILLPLVDGVWVVPSLCMQIAFTDHI